MQSRAASSICIAVSHGLIVSLDIVFLLEPHSLGRSIQVSLLKTKGRKATFYRRLNFENPRCRISTCKSFKVYFTLMLFMMCDWLTNLLTWQVFLLYQYRAHLLHFSLLTFLSGIAVIIFSSANPSSDLSLQVTSGDAAFQWSQPTGYPETAAVINSSAFQRCCIWHRSPLTTSYRWEAEYSGKVLQ